MRVNGNPLYFYEREKNEASGIFLKSLYDNADWLEETTLFELQGLDPETQLNHLKDEIIVRVKITKQEIFKIGELLSKAKKICQEQKTGFKDWIEENFDFSYETANNFMNVHKHCLSHMKIALGIPTSILYKISSPSFPDELREYLFDKGNITEITNGQIAKIVDKYKEGGIESIEEDVQQLSDDILVHRQTSYTLDMMENTLRTLETIRSKIECRGGKKINAFIPFEDQVGYHQPLAEKVNMLLYNALNNSVELIENAVAEAQGSLTGHVEEVQEKHFSPKREERFDDDEM